MLAHIFTSENQRCSEKKSGPAWPHQKPRRKLGALKQCFQHFTSLLGNKLTNTWKIKHWLFSPICL